MKTRYISLLAIAGLLLPAATFAADDTVVTGKVVLGVRGVDENDNSAKFQEYRDMSDAVVGKIVLDAYREKYHFELTGKNIMLDDQSYTMKGGKYGQFKYSFHYDQIPHNYSFGDLTFYTSGVGTNTLTFSGSVAPVSQWGPFEYKVDRKNYGADIEASFDTPFYFGVGVNRLEMDGLRPLTSGSFSGVAELPEPVDYATKDLNARAGYRSDTLMLGVTGMLSKFNNDNLYLSWKNPATNGSELNTLPPENTYGKIAADLAWRKLPLASTFALHSSYSTLENDFTVSDLNITAPAGLNTTQFDGDITYTDVSVALSSRPMPKLDTKLYYTYLEKENDSTAITYTGSTGNSTDIFDYEKNKAGLDVAYRLPMRTKVQAGYEYYDIDRRNRKDAESTTDNSVFIELKNSTLDYLTAKVKYTHLERDSDFGNANAGSVNTDDEWIERFVRRFDATDKSQDEVKLSLELYPVDAIDLGLEYSYVKNDYDEIVLGRTEDKGSKFYADIMCRLPQKITLSAFGGYETYQADSNHYNFSVGQSADPTVDDGNPATFRWTQEIDDDFWTYGVKGQMPLMNDKLNLIVSYEYQESEGEVDFTTQGTTALHNIDSSGDYTKDLLEAKAIYAYSKNIDVALGYMYEKYQLTDYQWKGYEYTPNGSYLTGAYADHDYEANVGYMYMKYKF